MGRISDYLGFTGGSDPHEEIARLRRRVDALEAALREVCERTGLDPAIVAAKPSVDAEVLELVRAGQKIHAIKRYREVTGAGLREAKEAVEAIERRSPGAGESTGPWLS